MHFIDAVIFVLYMIAMLAVGLWFHKRNQATDDYYVGGRNMGSWHIGLSVVATDVGGGFSIGLGGLGFIMGLSGSWMLFTGLIGAWLAAVILIPAVRGNPAFAKFQTFPELFKHFYGSKVAIIAGLISLIGYTGFTSSQVLAGAKLASSTFDGLNLQMALWVMGAIAVIYTVLGGLKAVIYTDTIQWVILLVGLIVIAIPIAWVTVGGWEAISATLEPQMLRLDNITWRKLLEWAFTIIPIWFVGMTLYQRIYASKDEKSAKKAWFIAGLLEWPLMAFMGVLLGMLAKVAAMQGILGGSVFADEETGLPLLLKHMLPAGLMGLVMSAYFSAILSTADSCLMAASGNLSTDIFGKQMGIRKVSDQLRLSQLFTLIIGVVAILIASQVKMVLDLMLYSYSFMVSGLLIPLLGGLYWKKGTALAAGVSMIVGGVTTVLLSELVKAEVIDLLPLQLDANIYGLLTAAFLYFSISLLSTKKA